VNATTEAIASGYGGRQCEESSMGKGGGESDCAGPEDHGRRGLTDDGIYLVSPGRRDA